MGYVSHAQRKAVWASKKDGGKGNPNKKSPAKMKEVVKEGLGGGPGSPKKSPTKMLKSKSPFKMEAKSPLMGKISASCKARAKKKFKVWPSAYASGWGVRCTKAGGPSRMGKSKKKK